MQLQKFVNTRGEVTYVDPRTNKVVKRESQPKPPDTWAAQWDKARGMSWRDY